MKRPAGRGGFAQIRRRAGIVGHLKQELASWVTSLESEKGAKPQGNFACVVCGRVCDRRFNMQRHAVTQ